MSYNLSLNSSINHDEISNSNEDTEPTTNTQQKSIESFNDS